MLWAQRICGRTNPEPHQVLEIAAGAGMDEAQEAFHKAARVLHPDLHRTSLTPEDLELVTTAYAKVAGAYQEIRSQRMTTTRMRPMPIGPTPAPTPRPTAPPTSGPVPTRTTPIPKSGHVVSEAAPPAASTAMSSKALVYYRKAELALRRGDLKGAVLQLKMAIAADPSSPFLRTALAEVEGEVAKQLK
jgi:hypothetical protein